MWPHGPGVHQISTKLFHCTLVIVIKYEYILVIKYEYIRKHARRRVEIT